MENMMHDDDILIRPAMMADLDTLIGLLGQLFGIESDFSFDADTHRRGLEALLGHPHEAWVWVAVSNGAVVGMCTGQKLISTAAGGPALHIEDMVIDAAHRSNGVGSALFAHIEHWALENGFRRMQLNADRGNTPALDFYRNRAWEQSKLVWLRKHLPAPERDDTP